MQNIDHLVGGRKGAARGQQLRRKPGMRDPLLLLAALVAATVPRAAGRACVQAHRDTKCTGKPYEVPSDTPSVPFYK